MLSYEESISAVQVEDPLVSYSAICTDDLIILLNPRIFERCLVYLVAVLPESLFIWICHCWPLTPI